MGGLKGIRVSETILDAVRRHARERGGDPAYRTPARSWSFAQLDEASNRVAQGLKSLGIGAEHLQKPSMDTLLLECLPAAGLDASVARDGLAPDV